MKKSLIEFYTRLAHGLAVQFGSNCEVVVHDLQGKDIEHSIIAIENGHVTGRRIGDGPSQIVLESLHNSKQNLKQEDKLAYLTKTKNGKILKSSTIFIRDDSDKIIGIFGINYDISLMLSTEASFLLHPPSGRTWIIFTVGLPGLRIWIWARWAAFPGAAGSGAWLPLWKVP